MGTGCDTQHTHLSILPVKLETQQKQTMNKKKLGLSKNKKQNLGTERALGIEARGSVLRLDAKAQSMGEKNENIGFGETCRLLLHGSPLGVCGMGRVTKDSRLHGKELASQQQEERTISR